MPHDRRFVLAMLALVASSACVGDPDGEAPARFVVGPCASQPPLIVTLHEEASSGELEQVGDDAPPYLHFGPQGGQHLLLKLAVENPSLERAGARIELSAEWCSETCEMPGSAGIARLQTLPEDPAWREENGRVWLGTYFLVLSAPPPDARLQLRADVLDACGRNARIEWAGQLEGL